MRLLTTATMLLAAALAGGCVASDQQLLRVSENTTGCSPAQYEQARISGYQLGMNTSSWSYGCRNRYWNCYASDTLQNPHCRRVDANGNAITDSGTIAH